MHFTSKWTIDPDHSSIEFKVRHLLISNISGKFNIFNGNMTTENDEFETAKITASIDVYSFDTNNVERDEHIKSKDFLDADKFPAINFESTSFRKIEGDHYKLSGEISVKNVKKQIELDVTFGGQAKDGFGRIKAGMEISGKLNRNDFDVLHDEKTPSGTLVIGDEIKIHANIEFDKEED